MTKKELEKEAEEYSNNLLFVYETDIVQRIVRERVRLALIDVLEPREKQIQIDAEQILALQKQNGELTDKVRELEAQVEKMKCCGNCKKLKGRFDRKTNINILYCSDSDMKQIEVGFQMCCCKWEIKEND